MYMYLIKDISVNSFYSEASNPELFMNVFIYLFIQFTWRGGGWGLRKHLLCIPTLQGSLEAPCVILPARVATETG